MQHIRPPCLSPTPRARSNSCPSSWWTHPTISSSAVPFSSSHQSFPASGSPPVSQFFPSVGQSIGASASESVLLMNIQSWCCLGLTGLISCSPVDSQESSLTPQFKSINDLALSLLYGPSKHDYWKTIALTVQTFVGKVMFLVFNMVPRLAVAFFQGASVF